jgi:hypothetical protein
MRIRIRVRRDWPSSDPYALVRRNIKLIRIRNARALTFYLGAGWRAARDANLNVLAFPGTVGIWGIVGGIASCAVSEVLAIVGGTR